MKLAKENLGKVSVTVEKAYHSINKEYDKLVVVEEEGQFRTFISRKPVPIGTELTDREFWLPFSSVKESIIIDYNKFKQYIRTGEGLLDDSIIERHIKNRNVTGDKIAEGTITFVNIADNTITLNKINDKAIDTTLTKEGYLAEAKHTGDRLLNIEGLSVVKVPSTQSTVLDAWQIIDKKGNIHGVTINTYKDKSIDAIWLSINENDPKPEDSEVKVDNPRYLNIIYNKSDGTQQKVSIPLASFVTEAEFSKNGFKVIDGVVNLKISSDITTSRYFHFDVDGNITLDGFEERILEDLGTLEHSVSGDRTMWGEFKKQEAIREQISNSEHQVFSDNWDKQDDDPAEYDPLAVVESTNAYNWKTTDTPASDGKTEGNLKDLYQKTINQDEKLSELDKRSYIVVLDEEKLSVEGITIFKYKVNKGNHYALTLQSSNQSRYLGAYTVKDNNTIDNLGYVQNDTKFYADFVATDNADYMYVTSDASLNLKLTIYRKVTTTELIEGINNNKANLKNAISIKITEKDGNFISGENVLFGNIKAGHKYNVSLKVNSLSSIIGIYTQYDGTLIDNLGTYNKVSELDLDFISQNNANKLIVYLSSNNIGKVVLSELKGASELNKDIETLHNYTDKGFKDVLTLNIKKQEGELAKYENVVFYNFEKDYYYEIDFNSTNSIQTFGIYTVQDGVGTIDDLGVFNNIKNGTYKFKSTNYANKLILYSNVVSTYNVTIRKFYNLDKYEESSKIVHKEEILIAEKTKFPVKGQNAFDVSIIKDKKYHVIFSCDKNIGDLGFYTTKAGITVDNLGVINNVNKADFYFTATNSAYTFNVYINVEDITGECKIYEVTDTIEKSKPFTGYVDEFFYVDVNGTKQNGDNDFLTIDDNTEPIQKIYKDHCHIVIPENDGRPVKLIILPHGAGGQIVSGTYDSWYLHANRGLFFNSLGYAVLTFDGLPLEWCNEHGLEKNESQCGNWMATESCEKAYQYVIEHYNIDKNGCYIFGSSQGGMVAENIVECTNIPILATVLEVPAISMQYCQLYLSGSRATYLNALYGFSNQSTYSKNKCIGLDPFVRNMDGDITFTGDSVLTLNTDIDNLSIKKYRKNTPMLILTAENDSTVSSKVVQAYAKAIRNAGGNCKLIIYKNTNHNLVGNSPIVGTCEFYYKRYTSGHTFDVSLALVEIAKFLHRHGGYEVTILTK